MSHFYSPFTDTAMDENEIEDAEEATTHEPFPYFDEPNSSVNVTTHLGNSVYLHCRVHDLNGKTVSITYIRFGGFLLLLARSNEIFSIVYFTAAGFYIRFLLFSESNAINSSYSNKKDTNCSKFRNHKLRPNQTKK